MPEILEIEMYRRGAKPIIGRRIAEVDAPDAWFLKGADARSMEAALVGARIATLDRIGKLLLMVTDAGTVGLRFGMTGRLVIDDEPIIPVLEYSSKRLDVAWNRFRLVFEGGGDLAINDPRRLGGVELEPDRHRLGSDAWSLTLDELTGLVGRTTRPLKALLLDQSRIAGLGNLLADELCWRTGIHPGTPCDELDAERIKTLAMAIAPMLDELYERGGSHCGDHVEARNPEAPCPRDGGPMAHGAIAGRSTWWCRDHQGSVGVEV